MKMYDLELSFEGHDLVLNQCTDPNETNQEIRLTIDQVPMVIDWLKRAISAEEEN